MTTKEKKGTGFFLAILTVVTAVCIIVGCILHLGFGFSRSGNGKMKSDEVAAERFNSISLELDAGDIIIEKGKSFNVSYRYPSNALPEIKVSGDKLVVKQKMKNIHLKDLDCSLTITVPEGEELEGINGDLDVCSLKINGFLFDTSSKIDITTDVGSIEFADCTFGDLKIDADVGNILFDACTFKELKATGDVGDIEINKCTFDSAECKSDTGSIDVSGSFSDLVCRTDAGSITVETDKPVKDEKMDLKVSIGDVTVNGADCGTSYRT